MPELVKISSELFPRLYHAFLHDDDPLSDEQDWRNVFDYRWQKEEDHSGYALVDGDQVVGMLAMAFSRRLIEGKPRKFCNLHTWWVHDDYRGYSVMMLRPLLSMKDYTITHFTPCDRVRALTKRLGFSELDVQLKILLPRLFGRDALPAGVRLDFDEQIDETALTAEERKICRDHKPYRLGHLLLRQGKRHCYIVYSHVQRYRVRYCHLHHLGDKALYARHEPAVRAALMRRHGVRFVMVDNRMVKGLSFSRSFDFWAPAHAVYRPADEVAPEQVDNLYSDVVMLRLALMPHVTHELKERACHWLPGLSAAQA